MDCIFCKIINKEIKSTIIYEDENVVAVDDLSPRAPTHKLILPRKHIATINDLTVDDNWLVGQMVQTAKKIASDLGHAEKGYRLILNCNNYGGQTVFHLHLHLLAGRVMTWPPG